MLVSIYHVVTRVPEEDSSKHQSQEQRHRAQDKSSPFFHKYCKKTEVSSLLSLKIAENEESKENPSSSNVVAAFSTGLQLFSSAHIFGFKLFIQSTDY